MFHLLFLLFFFVCKAIHSSNEYTFSFQKEQYKTSENLTPYKQQVQHFFSLHGLTAATKCCSFMVWCRQTIFVHLPTLKDVLIALLPWTKRKTENNASNSGIYVKQRVIDLLCVHSHRQWEHSSTCSFISVFFFLFHSFHLHSKMKQIKYRHKKWPLCYSVQIKTK